ncbi:MAG: FimV/HubP family polar landmark protein [Halopseudomonas sp.]|uniref:type IV pilus assembly protein FimV n=1 Tax=Halopseudomonas sp. TaxID=2901191 RepID=UPI0030026538
MAVKRQIVLGAASLAALYVGVTNALGLGEMQLDSALNQPLSATIVLQGAEGLSPDDVLVSLADAAAFDEAGIERPYFLTDLRFKPVMQGSKLAIQVDSSQPVREPYLNFLVELRRPNGRLLREYTVLLDPPLYGNNAPAPVQSMPQSAPPARVQSADRAPAPISAPDAQPLPDLKPQSGAQQYTTVSGDTLWDIAQRTRPAESASIPDTMAAIHALNTSAFVDGDRNRLRLGQTLTLPTADQLGVTASEPTTAQSSPEPVPEPSPGSGSQALPSESAQRPLTEAELAATDAGDAADADASAPDADTSAQAQAPESAQDSQARLRIEEGEATAAQANAAELLGRLTDLEGRFNALLSELDDRDRQIASLQAELEVLRAAREAEDEAAIAAAAAGTVGSGAGGADASISGSDDPAAGAISTQVLPPEATEQQQSSSWFSWWALVVAGLAFLFGWLISRLRAAGKTDDGRSMPTEPVLGAAGMASPRDQQNQKAVAQAAPEAPVDPLDDLDGVELYITYGRFAEARTMLEKSIAEEPERLELRYKQARVMGELGDAEGFAEQAAAIEALDGDMGRVDQLRARFPQLETAAVGSSAALNDTVEDVLADDENLADSRLNLNDFTLDPDWELIEGLSPAPARKSADKKQAEADQAEDDDFESSLHEFPEIEELDEDHRFSVTSEDERRGRDD